MTIPNLPSPSMTFRPNQVNRLPGSIESPTGVSSPGARETGRKKTGCPERSLLASATLDGVGLPRDGEDPLPRAAVHVEASRRVFH